MALTADRNTPRREADVMEFGVEESTTIFAGALTCLNAAGYAVPGSTATTLKAVGRADEHVVNAGADGAVRVRVRRGCFKFKNSAAGDAITNADYGATVYVVDDETVAKTNGSSTRSAAGICRGVDADGVWVEF